MKARNENGLIQLYGSLPENYSSESLGLVLGFDRLDKTVWESEGFFDVEIPEIDFYTQKLGEIYFDNAKNVFTYPVEVLEVPLPKPVFEKSLEERLNDLTVINNALLEVLASKGLI